MGEEKNVPTPSVIGPTAVGGHGPESPEETSEDVSTPEPSDQKDEREEPAP